MDDEFHLSHYSMILDSSIDGILAFDKEFKITLWNKQMERFSGLRQEFCLGKPAFEVFPLFKKYCGLPLQKVLKGRVCILKGMPFNPALNNGLKDYYEGYYSPIHNEKGEVTGIMGIIRELGYRPPLATHQENIVVEHHDKEETHRREITNQLININNRREELARIINKSPAIAFLWQVEQGRPVSFVSENINQFGYSQEEFQSGRTRFSEIVYKEDIYGLEFDLREYLLGFNEESFTSEYRITTKYGGMRWVQERSWPRIDEKGEIKFLEGLLVDISVRKFAEEALVASEEQFKLLFERAPIGMALLSVEGEILRVNNAFCELIGFSQEEFSNTRFDRNIHPVDKALFMEGDNALLINKSKEYQVENRFLKKNGDILYAITKIALTFDTKGTPSQKLVQIVDITNRKRAEIELVASQNKLQQAQTFAHLGNWELDVNINSITASDEVYNIYGYEKKSGLHSLDDFLNPIIPQQKDQVIKSFNQFIGGNKQGLNEEYKIVRSDGKILAVQTKAEMVLDHHKQPIMAIGTIQDITERKAIEEELKTRNDELTNFVYKVSHDLRSPLLSVSGLINLMKTSTLDNEQRKYISLIEDRVKRLDTFIMDILSHSKNLYTDIQIEKINFKKIIDGAFDDLAYLQNTSRISRKVNISKKAFYSDPQRLKDIFRNLISNSIQYIHPSKKINTLNIDISISERYASIIIEDNGLGIDKSVCPKIFNMFYRGNEISNGSGIGLYIVNQAVEKIGGNISVESVISQGSKFFITLPNLTDRKGKSMKCL
jgi:PAS domain S-box-containing protein